MVKKIDGFDTAGYQKRLQLLREIISGENQQEFADRLGIPFKRWNNYERGYPVPRETAFALIQRFPGISVEWIWFGWPGNLSASYRDKIAAAEKLSREQAQAVRALDRAKARVKDAGVKRKSALHPAR